MRVNYHLIQPHSILSLILAIAASLFTLRIGVGLAAWRAANQLERPSYSVIKRLPVVPGRWMEIRKYEPYLIAETTIEETTMRKAGSRGFGKCAAYIFGENVSANNKKVESEKMAMTAPVRSVGEKMDMTSPVRTSTNSGSDSDPTKRKTKISFVIGSKYTLKNVPRPVDDSVRIKQVKGHYLAATTFSGPPPSDERVTKERTRIVQVCEREGIRITSQGKDETIVYGYHDPVVTPNFLRRNEVCILVDGSKLPSD